MLMPDALTNATIEDRAEAAATQFGFDPETEEVQALVRRIGGRINLLQLPDERQLDGGSLAVRGPGDLDIYLSPYTGRLRDNFTIAHELGHYFLHTGTPPGTNGGVFGRYGDDIRERQANRFAAALLMPRTRFLQLADRYANNEVTLASCFNVSPKAAQVRLISLGRP
jgi:hypothetical protein